MDPAAPQVTETWIVRAARGSVARCVVCAPLSAALGLLVSLPQALFTVGIGCGLAVALTFGERWLTRRGVLNGGPAVAAGGVAWIVTSLALTVFVAQIDAGYGTLAWTKGPAVANEALLDQLGETSLPLLLMIGIVTTPVGLTFGGYVYSWTVAEAQAPASLASFFAAAPWTVLAFVLALSGSERSADLALAIALGVYLVSWIYQLAFIALALGGLAATGYLEQRLFHTHKPRWDADVPQGTRVKRPGRR